MYQRAATSRPSSAGPQRARPLRPAGIALFAAWALVLLSAAPAAAAERACSKTARIGLQACRSDVRTAYGQALGQCANASDAADKKACQADARAERRDESLLCREQFEARRELCEAIGEAPYDPDFDPANFDTNFDAPMSPNAYWPLPIGGTWTFEGGGETITLEVLDKTKLIEGVRCIVVHDRVEEDGFVKEDTFDWYALTLTGDVYYCGEQSEAFEHFPGDDPEEPEVVSIEGSWKAGRDGQKAGVVMFAAPQVGRTYRQEWAFLEAEDVAEVLSTSYGFGSDPELDADVPQALAEALCDGDCLVTRETSAIEPNLSERKYYAPGIGVFLEVDDVTGDTVELVACDVDPACATLP